MVEHFSPFPLPIKFPQVLVQVGIQAPRWSLLSSSSINLFPFQIARGGRRRNGRELAVGCRPKHVVWYAAGCSAENLDRGRQREFRLRNLVVRSDVFCVCICQRREGRIGTFSTQMITLPLARCSKLTQITKSAAYFWLLRWGGWAHTVTDRRAVAAFLPFLPSFPPSFFPFSVTNNAALLSFSLNRI